MPIKDKIQKAVQTSAHFIPVFSVHPNYMLDMKQDRQTLN